MRIELDASLCLGYGNCIAEAPEHFDLDEDTNLAIVLIENPDEQDRAAVEAAIRSCPAVALKLAE
jgi:ferredoxin